VLALTLFGTPEWVSWLIVALIVAALIYFIKRI
jgi:hypothetical protein